MSLGGFCGFLLALILSTELIDPRDVITTPRDVITTPRDVDHPGIPSSSAAFKQMGHLFGALKLVESPVKTVYFCGPVCLTCV